MPTRTMTLDNEAATADLARAMAARAMAGDAFLLSGPLGAGKSTFARAFIRARAANPALEVPSPSFTLVQGYELDPTVTHFDLWRLTGPDDAAELGFEQALAGIVLVEWPDRLGALAPAAALRITLAWSSETRSDQLGRSVTLEGPERLLP